jgi:GntR family transcriptional repressor for pyruvate dehydrogenase complex
MTQPGAALGRLDRQRESLSNEVAQVLLDHLVSGRYEPGQRLPSERSLADTLGVGRHVVREALKSLTLLGLVVVRQGDGTYLQSQQSDLLPATFEWGLLLGDDQIQDVIEARRELEVVLVVLAAQRRTEEDLADLHALLDRMRDAADTTEFVAADVAFHLRVAGAARNAVLQRMLGGTQSLLHAWISRVIAAADSTTPSYLEHEPILLAIEQSDAAAAQDAMRVHLDKAGERLSDTLAQYTGVQPR